MIIDRSDALTGLEARWQSPEDISWETPVRERWSLRRLQDEYILIVLRHTNGNRNRAARILGIDRRTLYRRLQRIQTSTLVGSGA